MPALPEIDPRAVARAACEALVEYIGRVALPLNPALVPVPRPEALVDGSDLGLTVQTLTVFAQRGAPVGDWQDSEDAADALLTVVSALYRPALGGEGEAPSILSQGEPESDLETVLLAAWTRVQLGRGEAVEPRQIACLASCPVRTVQQHVKHGVLPASDTRPARISVEAAREYLSARGVQA